MSFFVIYFIFFPFVIYFKGASGLGKLREMGFLFV
jgi:hypothetical protein